MGKVKITQEQARAIEERKRTNLLDLSIIHHVNGKWEGATNYVLNDLTLDEFIRALYIGYEVEEEFKVGDWVTNKVTGVVNQVNMLRDGGIIQTHNENYVLGVWNLNETRQATPEEIAEEKRRRFWHVNNRDVWELKKGDILKDRNLYYYSVIQPNLYKPAQNETRVTGGLWIADEDLEKNYKVACFARNRKDLKND